MGKLTVLGLFVGLLFSTTNALAANKSIECWAEGKVLRQTGGGGDHIVSARLSAKLEVDEDSTEALLKKYLGHIAIVSFADEATMAQTSSYYGIFTGEKKDSSLSKKARKYKDADYFRYRNFDANSTSEGDGGGMNGELVISKKLVTATDEDTFDAHYIFQAGDHMGGTIDYTCSKNW